MFAAWPGRGLVWSVARLKPDDLTAELVSAGDEKLLA